MAPPIADRGRTLVRSFFRAMQRLDLRALQEVVVPHPAVATLVPAIATQAPVPIDPEAAVDLLPLPGERWLGRLHTAAGVRVVLLQEHHGVLRADVRHWLPEPEAGRPMRSVAREFVAAFWCGDAAAMAAAGSDARDAAALVGMIGSRTAAAACEQHARSLQFAELQPGEAFHVGDAIEFVDAGYAASGITVLHGICAGGELPLLVKRTDDGWRVLTRPFLRNARLVVERCAKHREQRDAANGAGAGAWTGVVS